MINFISKLFTFYLPKKQRKLYRTKIKNYIYGYKIYLNAKKIGKNFVLEHYSRVNKNTFIGNNVRFNGVFIEGVGLVKIGNYCQFGKDVTIISSNHDYDGSNKIPYGNATIYKDTIIGDCVWVGSKVTILPGTKIGEGAIIQGGAVVHGKIPRCAIAGGNPAKVFKYRDIKHFDKLKAKGAYLEND